MMMMMMMMTTTMMMMIMMMTTCKVTSQILACNDIEPHKLPILM